LKEKKGKTIQFSPANFSLFSLSINNPLGSWKEIEIQIKELKPRFKRDVTGKGKEQNTPREKQEKIMN